MKFTDTKNHRGLLNELRGDFYGLRNMVGKDVRYFLDIGGNVGMVSMAAKFLFPQATIHTYEPCVTTAQVLQDNLLNMGIYIFNDGLAVAGGNQYIHACKGTSGCSFSNVDPVGGQPFPGVTFATMVKRLCSEEDLSKAIIKIDCEGAEACLFNDYNLNILCKCLYFVAELHTTSKEEMDLWINLLRSKFTKVDVSGYRVRRNWARSNVYCSN